MLMSQVLIICSASTAEQNLKTYWKFFIQTMQSAIVKRPLSTVGQVALDAITTITITITITKVINAILSFLAISA
ncbi:hypothetical protein VNO78_00780 [Psophocarpus tetragonolobus]|uniref:Uncharacterized protein n=1 Tax=Psophocarpus tetragonolobus TaxID=3891 RepID=A0AAN9T0U7_PSOTE